MSLASELLTLTEEIKSKQEAWLALSAKAGDESHTLTAEDKEQLAVGNKALSDMVDKKIALETQITDDAALKSKLVKMTAADQEALEKARSSAPTEKGQEPWFVKAAKAMMNDLPTDKSPYKIEESLKALFNEGAFTAASGNVPGYYVPGNDQGYPPELRRDPTLFVPDAVRPVQFWNTIQQIPTDRPTDVYMVETVNADGNAPFTAEGGAYIEDPGFDYKKKATRSKTLGFTTRHRGIFSKTSR